MPTDADAAVDLDLHDVVLTRAEKVRVGEDSYLRVTVQHQGRTYVLWPNQPADVTLRQMAKLDPTAALLGTALASAFGVHKAVKERAALHSVVAEVAAQAAMSEVQKRDQQALRRVLRKGHR